MANYNKVIIAGNLASDPELRSVNGSNVVKISVAYNEKYKDSKTSQMVENVHFFDANAWGATADAINKYLKKVALFY